MSFLKKIKKVLAMLSPWASVKSSSKKRKKIKSARQPRTKSKKSPRKKRAVQKKNLPTASKKKTVLKKKPVPKKVKVAPTQLETNLKKRAAALKKPPAKVKKIAVKVGRSLVPKAAKPKRILVGEVTHYFDRAKVAAFMVTGAPIILGDALEFEGKCTPFRQEIKSLQMDRLPVKSARAGDEVGLLVKKQVYEGDFVFKVL